MLAVNLVYHARSNHDTNHDGPRLVILVNPKGNMKEAPDEPHTATMVIFEAEAEQSPDNSSTQHSRTAWLVLFRS